jgi:hypothetical protein
MFEYAAFNPFNASPEGLAAELTRKSADGRFCAFLRRPVAQRATAAPTVSASTPAVSADTGYAAAATTSASPTVPAAWYKDPSGRYEMRYWNGNAWTEHVARGGQQFTDPPVA